jgi:hypothetical protein
MLMTNPDLSMSGISQPVSGAVVFRVPFVRALCGVTGCVAVLSGLSIVIGVGAATPLNWPGLALALIYLGLCVGLLIAGTKGYTLTVTRLGVVCHKLLNKTILFSDIESVELVRAMARLGQPRTCLNFHLCDGDEYLYKLFTGSTTPGAKSYVRVAQAKLLIDQRVAAVRVGSVVPPPPSPPGHSGVASPPMHSYDDPGAPRL